MARLVEIAREIAASDSKFQEVKGAGKGDHATARFMRALRDRIFDEFSFKHCEKKICGPTGYAVDFYFEDQATIVEVALGLSNPASEFEKDILKAIVAKEHQHPVDRLVFISRAGAEKKCMQPGRIALMNWAKVQHGVRIEVYELPGNPRVRVRQRRRN